MSWLSARLAPAQKWFLGEAQRGGAIGAVDMAKILELKSNRAPGSWQGLKVEPGNLANRNRGASCALCRHRRSRELRALSANEEGESVSPSHQSSATNPSVVRGGRFTVAPFTRRVLIGALTRCPLCPNCDQVLHRSEMSRGAMSGNGFR